MINFQYLDMAKEEEVRLTFNIFLLMFYDVVSIYLCTQRSPGLRESKMQDCVAAEAKGDYKFFLCLNDYMCLISSSVHGKSSDSSDSIPLLPRLLHSFLSSTIIIVLQDACLLISTNIVLQLSSLVTYILLRGFDFDPLHGSLSLLSTKDCESLQFGQVRLLTMGVT